MTPADAFEPPSHREPPDGTCARCGSFTCAHCRTPLGDELLCDRCAAPFWGPPSREAKVALAAGVAGFLFIVPGLVAGVLGHRELQRIEANRSPRAGRPLAKAAKWIGVFEALVLLIALVRLGRSG